MSKQDLRRSPHKVKNIDWAWWYEEKYGICVVVHQGTRGAITLDIPWRSIRAALKRLDKKEQL